MDFELDLELDILIYYYVRCNYWKERDNFKNCHKRCDNVYLNLKVNFESILIFLAKFGRRISVVLNVR